VFPISEKRNKTKKTPLSNVCSEGKWTSNEKLKNALIASTDESKGVICQQAYYLVNESLSLL
jgi:hypothetical protein